MSTTIETSCVYKCKLPIRRLRCSRCKQQYYCSRACQKKHWSEHKVFCGELPQPTDRFADGVLVLVMTFMDVWDHCHFRHACRRHHRIAKLPAAQLLLDYDGFHSGLVQLSWNTSLLNTSTLRPQNEIEILSKIRCNTIRLNAFTLRHQHEIEILSKITSLRSLIVPSAETFQEDIHRFPRCIIELELRGPVRVRQSETVFWEPFPNVTSLEMSLYTNRLESMNLLYTRLWPQLQFLTIHNELPYEALVPLQHFGQLTTLRVHIYSQPLLDAFVMSLSSMSLKRLWITSDTVRLNVESLNAILTLDELTLTARPPPDSLAKLTRITKLIVDRQNSIFTDKDLAMLGQIEQLQCLKLYSYDDAFFKFDKLPSQSSFPLFKNLTTLCLCSHMVLRRIGGWNIFKDAPIQRLYVEFQLEHTDLNTIANSFKTLRRVDCLSRGFPNVFFDAFLKNFIRERGIDVRFCRTWYAPFPFDWD